MSMKGQGKYVEFFFKVVEDWREKLSRVDAVVNVWLKVQKDWRTLVNIFLASDDIRTQLPEDTKVFEMVDKEFMELMMEVSNNPGVVEACINERKD
jgi:dynein heavy chain, axonemal